jgi:hypothetical protein
VWTLPQTPRKTCLSTFRAINQGCFQLLFSLQYLHNTLLNLVSICVFTLFDDTYPFLLSHLPVHKLLFQCSICGHGGHQECYRAYYADIPMVPVKPSRVNSTQLVDDTGVDDAFPPNRHDVLKSSSPSKAGASEGNQYKADTSSDAPYQVIGHLCASGCGHFCWATTIKGKE